MTLGLTEGTNNGCLAEHQSYGLIVSGSYGGTIGTSYTSSSLISNKNLGITLDSSKSGIESEINSNIKYIVKY